jgi:putative transposase
VKDAARQQGGALASAPASVGEVDTAREAAGPPGDESANIVRKQGGAPASVPASVGEVDTAREAAGPPACGLPVREYPAHLPNVERHNQPIILLLTVCTYGRKAVLANELVHEALRNAWSQAHQYRVGSYVIMPDHVHLFCSPALRQAENVKSWATYWKRLASRDLKDLQPLWQRDCWDTQLRHVDHYMDKWEYMRANPVRKELVESPDDWLYQGSLNELRW